MGPGTSKAAALKEARLQIMRTHPGPTTGGRGSWWGIRIDRNGQAALAGGFRNTRLSAASRHTTRIEPSEPRRISSLDELTACGGKRFCSGRRRSRGTIAQLWVRSAGTNPHRPHLVCGARHRHPKIQTLQLILEVFRAATHPADAGNRLDCHRASKTVCVRSSRLGVILWRTVRGDRPRGHDVA